MATILEVKGNDINVEVEDSQKTKDIGLSWALSTMYRALAQYKDHIFTYQ